MRVGLIARADDTGLGVQTWEFYRHMKPAKTLVVDISNLNHNEQHPERYPEDAVFVKGFPTPTDFKNFLQGLDVVFTCEIPYGYNLFTMADFMGVKTVLQYNYEFLDYLQHPELPKPTLFAAPTVWHYDDVPYENKYVLPVPIATDRLQHFATRHKDKKVATHFIHSVGKPAVHDRNGTPDLLSALQFVQSTITVTLKCQDANYVQELLKSYKIPANVTINVQSGAPANYWDNYAEGDVLIMPRRYGGLCLPVNEALGAGMPVIMPAIDPNDSWLNFDWLVPAKKYGEFMTRTVIGLYATEHVPLARKIDQFATDEAFYAKAKNMALNYAKELSWDNLKPEYDRVFKEICDGRDSIPASTN